MRNLATFVLLFAVWMLWSGHTEPLLVGLGLGSAALAVFLGAKLHLIDEEAFAFRLTFRLLGYVPWALWQVVKTNVEAARIILHPNLPHHSHLVHVAVTQRTALGQVIHANTLTLTPGTVTLDVRNGTFLIHALTRKAAAGDAARNLDRRVSRLEGKV